MRAIVPLPVIWLFAALLCLVLAGCSGGGSAEGAGNARGHGTEVQAEWATNRRVTGHRVHVTEQHIACNRCHELKTGSVSGVPPTRCAACHAAEARIEHAVGQAQRHYGPGTRAECVSCHAFTSPAPPSDANDGGLIEPFAAKDCLRCHREQQGHVARVVVHASADCSNCHQPHRDHAPVAADCASCHQQIRTTHAALGKSAQGVCTTCHTQQHAKASDALGSCAKCHSLQQPLVPATALFPSGHAQCVSCHQPHAFEAQRARPCRSCHAQVVVLAQAKVPAHAICASCHRPHDVRGAPAQSCANCHWDEHSDHPELTPGHACTTCHDAHPRAGQERLSARTCSSCHQNAASERAFHGGASCQSCHTPHHFKLDAARRQLCQSCHEPQLARTRTRAGHAACESCHSGLPHQPALIQDACSTCHASVRRQVRTGHQVCGTCHEPHSGAVASDCKSCHAQQFTSAPPGHRACTNCHQPHSGSTVQGACATCHVTEAASAHGKLATGCNTCHRPHGPQGQATAPACSSCHGVVTLPGLHVLPQHQACKNCHGGHDALAQGGRTQCLSCHAERAGHFPDARRCASCHLFQSATRPLKGR